MFIHKRHIIICHLDCIYFLDIFDKIKNSLSSSIYLLGPDKIDENRNIARSCEGGQILFLIFFLVTC